MKGNIHAKTPREYIDSLEGERKAAIETLDSLILKTVPNLQPYVQYGMLGYGNYHFVYASGREIDSPVIALASQKNYISLYTCMSEDDLYVLEHYKDKLPKANIGKGCIRFKKLEDVDLDVIKEILLHSERIVLHMKTATKNN